MRLADEHGQTSVTRLPHLLTDASFERLGQCDAGPVLPAGLLNGLAGQTVEDAKWWEHQIVEVMTGRPPDTLSDARPRPGFDPETHMPSANYGAPMIRQGLPGPTQPITP